jgi:hypothetical protein
MQFIEILEKKITILKLLLLKSLILKKV